MLGVTFWRSATVILTVERLICNPDRALRAPAVQDPQYPSGELQYIVFVCMWVCVCGVDCIGVETVF